MNVETEEVEEGTRILVEADSKVAVVVQGENGERIYLPESSGSDDSYYVEEVESLQSYEDGYVVTHPGEVEDFHVLG